MANLPSSWNWGIPWADVALLHSKPAPVPLIHMNLLRACLWKVNRLLSLVKTSFQVLDCINFGLEKGPLEWSFLNKKCCVGLPVNFQYASSWNMLLRHTVLFYILLLSNTLHALGKSLWGTPVADEPLSMTTYSTNVSTKREATPLYLHFFTNWGKYLIFSNAMLCNKEVLGLTSVSRKYIWQFSADAAIVISQWPVAVLSSLTLFMP